MNVRVRDSIRGVSAEEGYKASELGKQRYKEQDDINHPDMGETKTLGWRPSCRCNAPAVPAVILDPFAGSGTTLAVAKSLGHIGIGYELSTEYLPMIKERLEDTAEGDPVQSIKTCVNKNRGEFNK